MSSATSSAAAISRLLLSLNTLRSSYAIQRSAWKVDSPKFAWPRPNTYECPRRISASLGYYPYFLIIPFRERCPFAGFLILSGRGCAVSEKWPPGRADHGHLAEAQLTWQS